jgi:hypothetical protein
MALGRKACPDKGPATVRMSVKKPVRRPFGWWALFSDRMARASLGLW